MAKPKIFIVDDDPSFIILLKRELEEAGFTNYETYDSGEECLNNMKHNPRLVLLDFALGGLNGLDVLRRIKENHRKTDVVILTAIEDEAVKEKCLEEGATNYIHKNPDGLDRLRTEVLPAYKGGFFSFFS